MNDGSDRNGGLVSWMDDAQRNHFRLRNIEQYLGKPITEASTSEQLQAMVWEMKKRNPSAYRAFMNPNSTDIQLRRASESTGDMATKVKGTTTHKVFFNSRILRGPGIHINI